MWTDSLQFPFVRTMTTTGCLKPLVIQIGQETRAEVRRHANAFSFESSWVHANSRTQKRIALSGTESEYVA